MKTHAPIHPSEDFLIPLGVPPRRINEIVKAKRALTVDTADVWLNLQSHHDQQTAKATMKSALAEIQPCPAV